MNTSSIVTIDMANLYRGGLKAGAQASRLDAKSDEAAATTEAALSSFRVLSSRISSMGLFPQDDTLEDVSSRNAPYIMLPYAIAQVMRRQYSPRRLQRLRIIQESKTELKRFTKSIERLSLVPDDERKLFGKKGGGLFGVLDVAKKKENKGKQLQKEKELKEAIMTIRAHQERLSAPVELDSDLDAISAILDVQDRRRQREKRRARISKRRPATPEGDSDDDWTSESGLRDMVEVLIRLCWARAHLALSELRTEQNALEKAPKDPGEEQEREEMEARDKQKGKGKAAADGPLKLDGTRYGGRSGPEGILDGQGNVLKPFTAATTSTSTTTDDVPSMSIDEYLAEALRRKLNPSSIKGPDAFLDHFSIDEIRALITQREEDQEEEYDPELDRIAKQEYWDLYKNIDRRRAGTTVMTFRG
ncbi:hypothetical protein DL93DRAFT_2087479 [Clavulina sp. PMI_390]|nr:hypothetical protein DL93DRAFT_2087479 [Clavulina sp. PMI_390]